VSDLGHQLAETEPDERQSDEAPRTEDVPVNDGADRDADTDEGREQADPRPSARSLVGHGREGPVHANAEDRDDHGNGGGEDSQAVSGEEAEDEQREDVGAPT
jgi:hypothetical protein